ncbi:MAG: S41 family peptidase [Bacteroidota bacterium]
MRKTILLAFCFLLLSVAPIFAQENPIVRYPSISPDGAQISFSYQGDIWTMPVAGGVARRLTIHESYESKPQWSPDGSQILFQGNRFGNNDLFLINADGSQLKRLTHHSTNDGDARWSDNGEIIFNTRRAFQQVEREQEVHTINKSGGTPRRIMDAVGLMPASSPGGNLIAFVRGTCRVAREAYTGPANRNIFLYNKNGKTFTELTTSNVQEIYPDWGGGEIFFLRAADGRYNIFKLNINADGKDPNRLVQLTNFKDEGIRYFDVTNNGSTIVFERGVNIYTMDVKSRKISEAIPIQVTDDYRFDPIEHKTFTNQADDYALSPNEKQIAFVVRGELFVKPNDKDKKRSVQLTNHPFRDKEPVWLNDTTLIFSSDRNGKFDLFMVRSSDTKTSNLYKTFKLSTTQLTDNAADEEGITISPDRKKMAYRRGRGMLVVADISADGLTNEKILLDGWDTPQGVSWSPDSRWLAYALDDLDFNQEIYIHAADGNRARVNVSLHPRGDSNPMWSRDGSKLGFLSTRNNGDTDVWFVWLKKEDWEKTQRDWEEDDEEEEKPKKDKGKKEDKKDKQEKEIELIEIDFEDIHERLVQVTRLAGNERNLMISKDGESFYFTTNGGGRQGSPGSPSLMSIKWNGKDSKTLVDKAEVSSLFLDKAGKNLYAIKRGGSFTKIKVDGGKQEGQGFQAKMDINHQLERKQVFEEAWRRLRDGFYDPNFHGRDWNQLRKKYLDRCMQASTRQDFQFFYNEMLGQLDASHMGLRGGSPEEDLQRERTGLLGIEVIPVVNGVKISSILPNSPADRTESKLAVGEIIHAVNGQDILASTNFYQLLNGKTNEKILLEVSNNQGVKREVVIRPTGSLRSQLYNDWVKERRQLTEKYSNGRLGYIHIQGMNWPSFERFERELTASGLGKEGIVIDVRFNGGGWTTDMLMTVLNVRQHAYTVPRGAVESLEKEHMNFRETYPFGERLPLSSWTRPSIALCNENSYSNAEIFSHAFKTLDIGTLVGMPTFGAVISTGGAGLLDGSYVRMPFRAWYVKATNENMEWGPAVPDIEIQNSPDGKAKGEDEQLKRAVEELLKQIGK